MRPTHFGEAGDAGDQFLRNANKLLADLHAAEDSAALIVGQMRMQTRRFGWLTLVNALIFGCAGAVFAVDVLLRFI